MFFHTHVPSVLPPPMALPPRIHCLVCPLPSHPLLLSVYMYLPFLLHYHMIKSFLTYTLSTTSELPIFRVCSSPTSTLPISICLNPPLSSIRTRYPSQPSSISLTPSLTDIDFSLPPYPLLLDDDRLCYPILHLDIFRRSYSFNKLNVLINCNTIELYKPHSFNWLRHQ